MASTVKRFVSWEISGLDAQAIIVIPLTALAAADPLLIYTVETHQTEPPHILFGLL